MSGYRTQPLPAGWKRIRKRILQRDPYCMLAYTDTPSNPCTTYSTEVDHIIPTVRWPAGQPGEYDDSNLQGVCANCHSRKTGYDSGHRSRRREPERHPGSVGVG